MMELQKHVFILGMVTNSSDEPLLAHPEAVLGQREPGQLWFHSWEEEEVCWGKIQ